MPLLKECGAVEDPSKVWDGSWAPEMSTNGGEAPERGADVLDATGGNTEHAPRVRAGLGGTRRLVHAEEVKVSHETLTVAIDDTRPEHESMVHL